MSFVSLLPFPLSSSGAGTSDDVPGLYAVAINGRPFMVDLEARPAFGLSPVPLLRNQADTGELPSERSLNPAGLWRQSQETWHLGAGQSHLDWADSTRFRFRSSKGINPWERWELSLLAEATNTSASANTNLALAVAGTYLYRINGAALEYTLDASVPAPVWTTVTGTPGGTATAIVSDGFNVYVAYGASGIYRTTRGAATAASYITGTVTGLGFVKRRLMASNANSIYNIVAALPGPAALPAALFTEPISDFQWTGFAEGSGRIYASGFSGDKSEVYRIAIKADGTGLDAPIPGTPGLLDGETVRSIGNYSGFILLGTDKGLRFCSTDAGGDLTIGALIETGPVRCFEGQGRFVWFGWDNYDGSSTGLGRLDLSTVGNAFLAPLTPAYASDLMASGQGQVTSVVTFGGRRVFCVAGIGVVVESLNKVASGTIDTGVVTYGLGDPKIAMFVDVRHRSLAGSVAPSLAANAGVFTPLGVSSIPLSVSNTVSANQSRGEKHELRLVLGRSQSDATAGPTLTRWTVRSQPDPDRVWIYTVPLVLAERIDTRADSEIARDPVEDLDFLTNLLGNVVTFQEPCKSTSVILEDMAWQPTHETLDRCGWNSVLVLQLKTIQ